MKKSYVLAAVLAIAFGTSAHALEETTGKVSRLESTYLPGTVAFWMDSGTASCKAGTMLFWSKADLSNNKATYATLMLALATGKRVNIYINDGDTKCAVQFLHLVSD